MCSSNSSSSENGIVSVFGIRGPVHVLYMYTGPLFLGDKTVA